MKINTDYRKVHKLKQKLQYNQPCFIERNEVDILLQILNAAEGNIFPSWEELKRQETTVCLSEGSSRTSPTNRQLAQMKKFKQGFSKRLNLARKRANLSLRGLASLIDTTYVSVHQWERGVIPQDKFIIKLAEALNVEVDWLLGVNVDREIDNWFYEIINASKEKQEVIKKTWEAIKNL